MMQFLYKNVQHNLRKQQICCQGGVVFTFLCDSFCAGRLVARVRHVALTFLQVLGIYMILVDNSSE